MIKSPFFSRYTGALCCLLLLTEACKERDPFSFTEAEIVQEMKDNKNYDKLLAYGESVGITASSDQQQRVLSYLEELAYGHKPGHVRYFEDIKDADTTVLKMAGVRLARGEEIEKVMADLEPRYTAYQQLKKHHARLMESGKADSARQVAQALNVYRWINRQARGAERLALVNIRGAYLVGMDSTGKEAIRMNVIVGKSDSPTPGLDTYATNIVTYPYWNVPKSIAVVEMLPRIQENVYYLERNGIEVLDKSGEVVDEHTIDWSALSEDDFPYRFRQETGEDNSLGVMKVNIENPYAIYLHDTNVRTLFDEKQRWRSHGCIRLEEPAQLANFLAGEKILKDTFVEDAVATPEVDRKPSTLPFKKKVPIFIYHLPADVTQAGQLIYFDDVYGLDKGAI
jgi:L,D-transpeptidase YcbB